MGASIANDKPHRKMAENGYEVAGLSEEFFRKLKKLTTESKRKLA